MLCKLSGANMRKEITRQQAINCATVLLFTGAAAFITGSETVKLNMTVVFIMGCIVTAILNWKNQSNKTPE